jgi:Flp pilus assembly protein TadG
MPSPATSKVTFRSMLRRFRRGRGGSAAVEFALVAPLFFVLLFAIVEIALMFFASQVLETVTQNAARMVLTGQAQTGQLPACATTCTPAEQFKSYVCGQIPALFDCSQVYVDVQSYSNSFASVTLSSHIDAAGNFDPTMSYNPGGAGQVVVVRLFYQWPLFVTGLGFNISNLAGNKRLLVATAAFQNEPY